MLNTDVSTGTTGAKRQSYASDNPRDVLLRVVTRTDDENEARNKCWDIFVKNQGMLRTIYEYWFQNNYRSLTLHKEPRRKRTRVEIEAAAAKIREHIEDRIEHEVTVRLFDMIMPSGKALSASSREELLVVSGWAAHIADRLKPQQTVAEAGLTEDDLLTIYRGHTDNA